MEGGSDESDALINSLRVESEFSLPAPLVSWRSHLSDKRKEVIGLSVAVVLGLVVFLLPIWADAPGAKRCLAVTVFVAINWSTTALPPFVTALCVPFLVVALNVLPFPAGPAATMIATAFFDPVILLFLGGLTFAAALDKYHLNQRFAMVVLRLAGSKPPLNLAALMGLSYFLSMWVTNVAASVVAVSIAKPIIDRMPRGEPYGKAMLLGIAAACNCGGMSTPIASPQNAIAVLWVPKASQGANTISFLQWMGYAVPFSLTLCIGCWAVIYFLYRPRIDRVPVDVDSRLPPMRFVHYYILSVVGITVIGWCTFQFTAGVTGNLGIISVFPVVALFGTGVLNKHDYESLSWSVLTLIGGGVALGVAATQSNLLSMLSLRLAQLVGDQSPWVISAAFVGLMGVIANFLPHSVIGIIVLPVVAQTGRAIYHEKLVLMMAAMMNSGASCLPVSSFPNANSYACRRHGDDEEVLTTLDFIKAGIPLLFLCAALLLTMGYGLFQAA